MDSEGSQPPAGDRAGGPPRPGTPDRVLERPCALVVSTARSARGKSVVVGWTADGLPMATTQQNQLGSEALREVDGYRVSGLPLRRIPYTAFVPVNYNLTGPAVDFADTAERRAEDQVRYSVVDAVGQTRDILLGERGVLGAIAEARVPWQAPRRDSVAAPASTAVNLYTLFAPLPAGTPDTGLAMLFSPTIEGETNEPAFRSFVRNTIGRLLVLDEGQPPRSRKGYLDVAGRLAASPAGSGGLLLTLRRLGLLQFDDSWYQRAQLGKRRMEGRAIRLLRGIGLVQVEDQMMADLMDPRPNYDIDPLEMDKLMDLAEQMYLVARKRLG